MGYAHIDNLYKNQIILTHTECYALEKIHGTSAHVGLNKDGDLILYSGGEAMANFEALFDKDALQAALRSIADRNIVIYGEAYGGKQQKMSETYGKALKFVAFDVKVDDQWLTVPSAEEVAAKCGIEFVDYVRIPTTLVAIDAERDKDSTQAIRNGVGPGKMREGVVLKPILESVDERGNRIMAKHKRQEFRETATPREVDTSKLVKQTEAKAIAAEWVTEMRLDHVLDKCPGEGMEHTGKLIRAMQEDVEREGAGEIEWNNEVKAAIAKQTGFLWKQRVMRVEANV